MRRICKGLIWVFCLTTAVGFTGCRTSDGYSQSLRVDTVVRIPVDPTEEPTREQTQPETHPTAETETAGETEPTVPAETTTQTFSGKTSTGKTGSSKTGTKTTAASTVKETEAAQSTEPPETECTEPPVPETDPPIPETEPPEETAYDPSDYSVGNLEYEFLEQLNIQRTEAGLPELPMDRYLCGIAAVRAEEIASLWSHTRPDGRDFSSVLLDYGCICSAAAENLAYADGSTGAADVVALWMQTPANAGSILSGCYTAAGIGIYCRSGVTYVACILIG